MRGVHCVCYIENVSPMKIKRIPVKSMAGPYSIVSGAGVIRRAAREIAALGRFSSVHIVSSPRVWLAVGKPVHRGLHLSKRGPIHLFDDAKSPPSLRSAKPIPLSLYRPSDALQSPSVLLTVY